MKYFIALNISTEISNFLFSIQNKLSNNELLTFTNSFHLTLKFLGDIDNIDEIITNLLKIKAKKFHLMLSELGGFPDNKSAKVIWVGVNPEPLLLNLHGGIDKATINIRNDFEFHPHITLARAKQKMSLPNIQIKKFEFLVNRFSLYQTQLGPNGVKYLEIKKFNVFT